MTRAELVFLVVGVFLGGIYADIGGPLWGVFLLAAVVGFVIAAAVTFWRHRWGAE